MALIAMHFSRTIFTKWSKNEPHLWKLSIMRLNAETSAKIKKLIFFVTQIFGDVSIFSEIFRIRGKFLILNHIISVDTTLKSILYIILTEKLFSAKKYSSDDVIIEIGILEPKSFFFFKWWYHPMTSLQIWILDILSRLK